MDKQALRKLAALATLINLCKITKKRAKTELKKIKEAVEFIFIMGMITEPMMLRATIGVFLSRSNYAIDFMYMLFSDDTYADYQDMFSDALLRRAGLDTDWFVKFLSKAEVNTGLYMIGRRSQDPVYQSLLINAFLSQEVTAYETELARGITHHPLTLDQLASFILETNDPDTKLIFANAAADLEDLDVDAVLEFFRHIRGDAQREVTFIDATHKSAGETFFILLTETEFEKTRIACSRKIKPHLFSLATIEYWMQMAEHQERPDAVRWFDTFIFEKYRSFSVPCLLDALGDLTERDQPKRDMIAKILSLHGKALFEIAGIVPPK